MTHRGRTSQLGGSVGIGLQLVFTISLSPWNGPAQTLAFECPQTSRTDGPSLSRNIHRPVVCFPLFPWQGGSFWGGALLSMLYNIPISAKVSPSRYFLELCTCSWGSPGCRAAHGEQGSGSGQIFLMRGAQQCSDCGCSALCFPMNVCPFTLLSCIAGSFRARLECPLTMSFSRFRCWEGGDGLEKGSV